MNDHGYIAVNPRYLVSITECPYGVKNKRTGLELKNESTIVETESYTYVVDSILHVDGVSDFHIHILGTGHVCCEKSQKCDFRPIRPSDEGIIRINQDKICSRFICPNGVYDYVDDKQVTTSLATIVETPTKTYVVSGVIHRDTSSKYLTIPLKDIIEYKPSEGSMYSYINLV